MSAPIGSRLAKVVVETVRASGHVTAKGTIRRGRKMEATWAAASVVEPLIPEGTLQWLVPAREGESVKAYAARVVAAAEERSAWAGGLAHAEVAQ